MSLEVHFSGLLGREGVGGSTGVSVRNSVGGRIGD